MRAFYLEPARWRTPFYLEGREARHLSRALRLTVGEEIRLLDGEGAGGDFTVVAVENSRIRLEPVRVFTHPRPPARAFLAAAYTRAARRGFMLEKAVELGAGGIWFWQAEHSQAKAPADAGARWREQLVAGAKQSLNPWLPELKTLPEGAGAVCAAAERFSRRFLLWEEAGAEEMLTWDNLSRTGDALFVMGPEGGLSKREVDIFKQNAFLPVSLGNRVLRWETAAVLCLGLSWWAGQARTAQGREPA